MNIGSINTYAAMSAMSTEMLRSAEVTMMRAVEAVSSGDIIEAAMSINEAKLKTGAGVAVMKATNEMSGMLLDILA